jgi:hypothetical protein
MKKKRSSRRRPQASRPDSVSSNPNPHDTQPQLKPTPQLARRSPIRQEFNTKRRGELAELAFTLKAASLRFAVAKPYGDSERYDFILDSRARRPHTLWRVQVKCTASILEGFYHLPVQRKSGGKAVPYCSHEIDFFAAYIVPEDTWYIIPLAATHGATSLLFRRKKDPKPGMYDQYREAWHQLRAPQ